MSTTNYANINAWAAVPYGQIFTPISTPTICQALQANGTSTVDPRWITLPGMGCGSAASYTCRTTPITDLYFRLTFTLQPCSILAIDWLIYASDYVADISVNGVTAYTTNYTSSYPTQRANATGFTWCTNWRYAPQINDIRVHIKTDLSLDSICRFAGMKVFTWGTNPTRYTTITGPSTLCAGQSASYSGSALSGATYSWTGIPGWPGALPNSTTYNTISTTTSGVVSLAYLTPVSTGYACTKVGGICVNVPPALTVTATSPTLCSGKCATLTALGAVSYTWTGPGISTPTVGNPIIICPPLGTSVYTVKGGGVIGSCVNTKTIALQTYYTPTVSATLSPTLVCQGQSATMVVTGNGWHYYLSPCGTLSSCQVFSNTNISVGSSVTILYTPMVVSQNGCTNSATPLTLSVNPNPTVTAVANPSVVCVGGGATSVLTAAGANTYVWSTNTGAPPYAINPKTVTPPGNICYTVTGAVGTCTASKVVCITTIAAPVIVVNPPQICAGITNTLYATGGNNYTWTLGIVSPTLFSNVSSVTLAATAAVPFTVCGTGANNCTACYYGTVSLGSPIPITAPNVALCSNAGPCTTLTASSSITPVTFTWSTGTSPVTGSAVSACPSFSTVYTVSASSTFSGCPSSATMAVSIVSNCCSQPTTGLTQLGAAIGGTYTNASYFLNTSTTLTNSAFFTNAEVWITENVTITVPSGKQMQLDKTHLFGCGTKMWQGIVVQDGGRINTVNTRTAQSMIEDAVVAINLDNISATNASPNPPIDISRIIFNRNYIGIKISNSVPTLTFLPLGINGCVFTSRLMTYTTYPNTLNWPNNDNTTFAPGALRWPTTATTGLAPPYGYMANNYPQANLKYPYTSQPGHIGIKIENIGDPNATGFAVSTNMGVDIGIAAPGFISNDVNLFEGIGHGIDITDACLVTKNNVFQNMQYYSTSSGMFGGKGINHTITSNSQRLTRLDLRNGNNNFWDCNVGVNASNVYQCWITNSVFRSTHNVWSANAPLQTTQGDIGVNYESDSLNFTVESSQFNNIRKGIVSNSQATSISSGGLAFYYNYFGPEVLSNTNYSSGTPNTSEYMDVAIDVTIPNATWPAGAFGGLIESNKIHRAFRGIKFDGSGDPNVNILANYIVLEDDQTYTLGQYGIAVQNNLGNMAVNLNTVDATGNWNAATGTTSAIYCLNNYDNAGTGSPLVSCNSVANTQYGFQFESSNASTNWQLNTMCNNKYGLALTANGIIGPQGNSGLSNANIWLDAATSGGACGNWPSGFAQYGSFCDNSSPTSSPIYIYSSPSSTPMNNASAPAFSPYYSFTTPPSLFSAIARLNDCPSIAAGLNPPSWRMAHQQSANQQIEEFNESSVKVYPNPTSAGVIVSASQEISVSIFDLSGKLLLKRESMNGLDNAIDLSLLAPSIYLMEFRNSEGKILRKKIVKTE